MEKNDIFNTNLLQLPMKAQVADEGAVQDTALAAEPTAPAMGEGLWALQRVQYKEDYHNLVSFFICAGSATLIAILFNYIRERKRCKQ